MIGHIAHVPVNTLLRGLKLRCGVLYGHLSEVSRRTFQQPRPSATLDDLLGRDAGTPLARVIDATFCVSQARHLKQPEITARILTNAA